MANKTVSTLTKEKELSTFDACGIIEGFTEEDASEERQLQAWASLIKSGIVWQLQGFYGRTASALINNKVISKKGEILKKHF